MTIWVTIRQWAAGNGYLINFKYAVAVVCLREEISAILSLASPDDEVRSIEPRGMVHAYGLASSQLVRLRHAQIPLRLVTKWRPAVVI